MKNLWMGSLISSWAHINIEADFATSPAQKVESQVDVGVAATSCRAGIVADESPPVQHGGH